MDRFSCAICQSERNLKACSGCGNVLYCSTEHQKQNWKEHKGSCRPFRVSCCVVKFDNFVGSKKNSKTLSSSSTSSKRKVNENEI
jgi:hypothetical protein